MAKNRSTVREKTRAETPPERSEEEISSESQDEQETEEELPVSSGTWLPEGLAIAGVMLSGAALLGPRLVQLLAVVTTVGAGSQVATYAGIVVGDGATALLGAVLAAVALASSSLGTRPWVRWLALAALVVGGIAVVVAAVTFGLLPAPQPQVPGVGG